MRGRGEGRERKKEILRKRGKEKKRSKIGEKYERIEEERGGERKERKGEERNSMGGCVHVSGKFSTLENSLGKYFLRIINHYHYPKSKMVI